MRTWLAAIAATLVQPLVFLSYVAYDLIRSPGPVYGAGPMVVSILAVAGAMVLLLGIPAFFLLRLFGHASWKAIAATGFALGALPVALLSWPTRSGAYSAGLNWHGQYVDTYINGMATQYAWYLYAESILHFGMHGLAGALVFYAVWTRLDRRGVTIVDAA